jgi:oxygen-independent coproporphyrinogen-3 oxidase
MGKFSDAGWTGGTSFNLDEITLYSSGQEEFPTREEFYTNYPFFKYWNNDNNEKLLSPEGINIYIHIPFCIQICDYCFYMKELIKSKDQVNEYVDALCKEIEMVSAQFSLGRRRVNSIYIGGGTPSVLTEPQFRKLIETLHRCHQIENPEFAFEAEPGTFSKNKLEWLKECGVNRISMGVQSFDDEVIRLSSRKHTSLQAVNSIKLAQEMGGFELNIDLLSGLAGESMDSWERSVDTALNQGTDMLTIYKMKTYANTVFFKKGVHKNEIELPTEVKEIDFMGRAIEKVFSASYQLWSNFAFTRNGCQSKYAENTWRGQDLIAYGASSFGKIGNLNYQNLNNIAQYSEKVRKNILPVYRTYFMSYKDMIVKELLLCSARLFSYKKSEFVDKFGFDYFNLIPETIRELAAKGYITGDANELVLTRQGVLFGDFVSKTIAAAVKKVLGKDAIGFTY